MWGVGVEVVTELGGREWSVRRIDGMVVWKTYGRSGLEAVVLLAMGAEVSMIVSVAMM